MIDWAVQRYGGVLLPTPGIFSQLNRYRVRVAIPSVGRATRSGRHRPVSPEQDPHAPGRELESYLAALAPESEVETTATGGRFGNAQVYSLRLPLIANEQLRELSTALGTAPQALAQEWIMQRLRYEFAQYERQTSQPRR